MSANPILAEQTRGPMVENRHRAAFVVADAAGRIVAALGDIERPIYPRSAVKSMQALGLVASGAIDRFKLTGEDLALACASHTGEAVHVAGVRAFLGRIGLDESALECGAHAPTSAEARETMRAAGGKPLAVHNNCSGKHSGLLATAQALGVDPRGYVERGHKVQQLVHDLMAEVTGAHLHEGSCGTDGCSIPTWGTPLKALATGFAKLATGEHIDPALAKGARRLFDAATSHPLLVAGTGQIDTLVMEAFKGRVMQKGGAEGVQCGAIRDLGLGYALKVDDGNMAASQAMVATLLTRFAKPDADAEAVLARYRNQPLRNVRGRDVGEMRASAAWVQVG